MKKEYDAFKKIVESDYPYPSLFKDEYFFDIFKKIYLEILEEHSHISNNYYSIKGRGILNLLFMDHFLILCHRLAHYIYIKGLDIALSEAIYYSARLRTSTDIFYRANIGKYFMPTHPLGSVIDSHSTYGIGFKLYNGVHIGPYDIVGKDFSNWKHPKFGDGVILFGGSSVYGETIIGDNVIVSAGSLIINEEIPSDCIVMGSSPRLMVKPNTQNNLSIIK
jgi:serine O-acetyltransferase